MLLGCVFGVQVASYLQPGSSFHISKTYFNCYLLHQNKIQMLGYLPSFAWFWKSTSFQQQCKLLIDAWCLISSNPECLNFTSLLGSPFLSLLLPSSWCLLDISSSIMFCHDDKGKYDMETNLLTKGVCYFTSAMIPILNLQSSHSGCKIVTMANKDSEPVTRAFDSSAEVENSVECDWRKHVSPDGDLYYYNCVACESRVRCSSILAFFPPSHRSRHILGFWWATIVSMIFVGESCGAQYAIYEQELDGLEEQQQHLHESNLHTFFPGGVWSTKGTCSHMTTRVNTKEA